MQSKSGFISFSQKKKKKIRFYLILMLKVPQQSMIFNDPEQLYQLI